MGKAHLALKHYSEVSGLNLVAMGPCFVLLLMSCCRWEGEIRDLRNQTNESML